MYKCTDFRENLYETEVRKRHSKAEYFNLLRSFKSIKIAYQAREFVRWKRR